MQAPLLAETLGSLQLSSPLSPSIACYSGAPALSAFPMKTTLMGQEAPLTLPGPHHVERDTLLCDLGHSFLTSLSVLLGTARMEILVSTALTHSAPSGSFFPELSQLSLGAAY